MVSQFYAEGMKKNLKILNNIKRWRKYQGLTQEELAEAVGVSPETISRLENSKRLPSIRLAFKISEVLQKGINKLFWLEEQ